MSVAHSSAPAWQTWFAPVTLGLAAVGFLLAPSHSEVPRPGAAVVPAAALAGDPMRSMMADPPIVHLGGFDRDCQDCHFIFDREERRGVPLRQHTRIELRHGRNNRCLGCHDQQDRNTLGIGGGETVGFADSDQLCATCHGPTWRDWERGIHGRSAGSWKIGSEERSKLTCVQCHDPHAPAFATMAPLPGPNTLRMGDPGSGAHHAPKSPLMKGYRNWTPPGIEASPHSQAAPAEDAAQDAGGGH